MWPSVASLGVLAFGLLFLGAYCVAETAANPGYSLVDAYWRGRLPWMGIAETLIVTGASACAVTGGATVLWLGGWWRRLLAIPALLAVAFWWLLGIVGLPGGGPCLPSPCPPQPIDPWAVAYSAPEEAFLFLILPSVLLALLALVAGRTATGPSPT
jgi:hypothetical protein